MSEGRKADSSNTAAVTPAPWPRAGVRRAVDRVDLRRRHAAAGRAAPVAVREAGAAVRRREQLGPGRVRRLTARPSAGRAPAGRAVPARTGIAAACARIVFVRPNTPSTPREIVAGSRTAAELAKYSTPRGSRYLLKLVRNAVSIWRLEPVARIRNGAADRSTLRPWLRRYRATAARLAADGAYLVSN